MGTTVNWPRDSQKPDLYINEKECTIWLLEVSGLKQRNLEISHDFANKNEEFYKPNIKKFLTPTNGMPSGKYSGEKPLFLLHPPKFWNPYFFRSFISGKFVVIIIVIIFTYAFVEY